MARADQVKAGPQDRREAAWPWGDRARHQAEVVGRKWDGYSMVGDPGFEPVLAIWFYLPDQTHIRSSRDANCTNIPLAAGRPERTKPFFVAALRGHAIHRFVHPDRPRL